jgi:hypothetical protein
MRPLQPPRRPMSGVGPAPSCGVAARPRTCRLAVGGGGDPRCPEGVPGGGEAHARAAGQDPDTDTEPSGTRKACTMVSQMTGRPRKTMPAARPPLWPAIDVVVPAPCIYHADMMETRSVETAPGMVFDVSMLAVRMPLLSSCAMASVQSWPLFASAGATDPSLGDSTIGSHAQRCPSGDSGRSPDRDDCRDRRQDWRSHGAACVT